MLCIKRSSSPGVNAFFISSSVCIDSHLFSNRLRYLAMTATKPITMHIKWTIKPDTNAIFLDAAKILMNHVIAEPECLYFNIFQDFGKPHVFKIVEMWNSDIDWIQEVTARQVVHRFNH